ncbi:hypothetical protein BD779DRAFT_1639520 [Infundibulicybe gibba]|nr:hypothetical protein BD779DRAFT_1639520 [Infundibulicybe gibba]
MLHSLLQVTLILVGSSIVHAHKFTIVNKCATGLQPIIADTSCGYSPRCNTPGSGGVPNPARPFTGGQPGFLAPGASTTVTVNERWNGRIVGQDGRCGAAGESCTMAEFNLDTGSVWTPQAYDISNIQGYTHPMSISVSGCDTVTCLIADCGCKNGYAIGDLTGCGNDSPVRGCSAGSKAWTVTFCP